MAPFCLFCSGYLRWVPFTIWEVALVFFYSVVWLLPRRCFSVRYRRGCRCPCNALSSPPRFAARLYGCFFTLVRFGGLLTIILAHSGGAELTDISRCVQYVSEWILFCIGQPIICYMCFVWDSRWWLGFIAPPRHSSKSSRGEGKKGKRGTRGGPSARLLSGPSGRSDSRSDIRAPLLEVSEGISASGAIAIAEGIDTLVKVTTTRGTQGRMAQQHSSSGSSSSYTGSSMKEHRSRPYVSDSLCSSADGSSFDAGSAVVPGFGPDFGGDGGEEPVRFSRRVCRSEGKDGALSSSSPPSSSSSKMRRARKGRELLIPYVK